MCDLFLTLVSFLTYNLECFTYFCTVIIFLRLSKCVRIQICLVNNTRSIVLHIWSATFISDDIRLNFAFVHYRVSRGLWPML